VCPSLRNNVGESLFLSLDRTPRRAGPKTARRWTEKEAGRRKVGKRKENRGKVRVEESGK
jgi:hypothetical protein